MLLLVNKCQKYKSGSQLPKWVEDQITERVKKLRGQGNGITIYMCTKATRNCDRRYMGEAMFEIFNI